MPAASLLFATASALAAFLLFWLQLLFGKLVLPLLGGAPAVWTTCLLFFQSVLLAAYTYGARVARLPRGRGLAVHAAVLLAGGLALPLAVHTPPGPAPPLVWLLGVCALSVGAPALAVSASSPLLQGWFSRIDHPDRADPYFLYAASNAGSLGALVAYPLVLERELGLAQQARAWTAAYGALAALLLAAGALRRGAASSAAAPRPARDRLAWLLLALLPSSLLYGVTLTLSTDVASAPLLWVLPLALYLASWVLAFLPRPWLPQDLLRGAAPLAALGLVAAHLLSAVVPLRPALGWTLLAAHLLGFLLLACVLHRELALRRPPPGELGAFYGAIALGGLLGGVFNAVLAPLAFTSVLEYPLMLLLAAFVAGGRGGVATPLAGGLLGGALLVGAQPAQLAGNLAGVLATLLVLAAAGKAFQAGRARLVFTGVLAVLMAAFAVGPLAGVQHAERSFFGVHRVVHDEARGFDSLLHGTTLHGRQAVDPARKREPLTYFHRTGPLGDVFAELRARERPRRAAVLGLGVGTLAAYAQAGQQWDFYEIDPVVERIARDGRWFTYLRDAAVPVRVVLGDGRLALRDAAGGYDLLVVDAFSSDATPVHLFTREAVALYRARLGADGVLVLNVSNRFLDLEPVMAATAAELGLPAAARREATVSEAERAAGKTPSHWIVLGPRPFVDALAARGWTRLAPGSGRAAWTDDHSNVLSALRR